MLPDNEGVVGEIGDVGATVFLVVLVEEQPAHVRVPDWRDRRVSNKFAERDGAGGGKDAASRLHIAAQTASFSEASVPLGLSHHAEGSWNEAVSPLEEKLTALVHRVGIGVGVGESVVRTVAPAPESNGAFEGAGAAEAQENL